MAQQYARIAIPVPLNELFDYKIPQEFESKLLPGMRVEVPFGRRISRGICMGFTDTPSVEVKRLKKISKLIDSAPVLEDKMIEFGCWLANYYCCSIGEALEAIVPPKIHDTSRTVTVLKLKNPEDIATTLKEIRTKYPVQGRVLQFLKECDGSMTAAQIQKKLKISTSAIRTLIRKEILEEVQREIELDVFGHIVVERTDPLPLTPAQEEVMAKVLQVIDDKNFRSILLHGVTGSGKTEIYLQSIEKVVKQGKEAIVLVPEISLTPQTVRRFRQRFDKVAVLHSELTASQRLYQWQQIYRGNIEVVIGPRSALFAPTRNLGLIVVDEEHEPSFKQQSTPRYHARDMAVKRAHLYQIPVILGSATPSLESYYNGRSNRYEVYELPGRVNNRSMPKITVVNMQEECTEQKRFVYLSRILLREMKKVLEKKKQIILFLNRRGFATTLTCPGCGYTAKCSYCDISLTYHKKSDLAICHYCNTEYNPPEICPICKFPNIRYAGAGTQRLEEMLKKFFEDAKIFRMDSDTMVGRNKYEEVFTSFAKGEIDILLGTQMIAKGLDFPNVTLVGVISADSSLQHPDFRAAERTFQLIVQVGGRSGRGEDAGQVIVQTYQPAHYAIQTALQQDYKSFVEQEMRMRSDLGYPPFGKLLRILVEGREEKKVMIMAEKIALGLDPTLQQYKCQLLGPAPAPLTLVKSRYRYHLIIKGKTASDINACSRAAYKLANSSNNLRVYLDIDPVSLM